MLLSAEFSAPQCRECLSEVILCFTNTYLSEHHELKIHQNNIIAQSPLSKARPLHQHALRSPSTNAAST